MVNGPSVLQHTPGMHQPKGTSPAAGKGTPGVPGFKTLNETQPESTDRSIRERHATAFAVLGVLGTLLVGAGMLATAIICPLVPAATLALFFVGGTLTLTGLIGSLAFISETLKCLSSPESEPVAV